MISVSHPTGNEFVRRSLEGLYNKGILHSFYTSIALFDKDILEGLSRVKGFKALSKRKYNNEYKEITKTNSKNEIIRQICLSLNLNKLIEHEIGPFSVDHVYKNHDKWFSKELEKKSNEFIKGILAFEDAALYSFNKAKILEKKCFYELSIGHYKALNEALEIEKNLWPDWEETLIGLKNSQEKLARKDLELKLADKIIVASSFTASTLENIVTKNSIKIIPYGFPETIHLNEINTRKQNEKLKVLFVGSLSQRKGIANVFKIANQFKDKIQLTVIGRKTCNNLPILDENLRKHQWIESMHHYEILKEMRVNHLLLFPSVFEGFGMVISEAMSQGLPVITSNKTMARDFIEHKRNGWIIEPNETESAAEIIEDCINNEVYRYAIASAGLETAQRRPWIKYGLEMANYINSKTNVPQ
jgi:glycosyltransferase involved in cell wall biosynthesis